MTETIDTFTFDFRQEAETLRADLRSRTKKMVFIEVDVPPAPKMSQPFVERQRIGDAPVNDKRLVKALTREFKANSSSKLIPLYKMLRLKGHVLTFNDNDRFSNLFGTADREIMRLFAFYHEAGHALVPNGLKNSVSTMPGEEGLPYPFGECAADAYAAIRLYQRFGAAAEPVVEAVSWIRAFYRDTAHMTTTVLDIIKADAATRDFSTLSPEDTLRLAEDYAKKWTPRPHMLEAYKKTLGPGLRNLAMRELMTKTCLSSAVDDFTFYMGARAAQPLLYQDGAVDFTITTPLSPDERKKFATGVEHRDSLRLSAIFAREETGTNSTLRQTLQSRNKNSRQLKYCQN